jgi:hypothetical protein
VRSVAPGQSANIAIVQALNEEAAVQADTPPPPEVDDPERLADEYEYAYWLGYIYRWQCHLHEESSRMVYGAFDEGFMRDFYGRLDLDRDLTLVEAAPEICRQMDDLLIGKE